MKIDITKKEYKVLLEVIEIADWILHSHMTDEDGETKHFKSLFRKIYSHAKDAGCGDLIEYDPEEDDFFPTQKFEEETNVMDFIDEYDDENFWSELADRLSFRDLVDEIGLEKLDSMNHEQRFEKICILNDKYANEFVENGLDRLHIRH